MTDFRELFDRKYLAAFDLKGRDVTVTIARVEAATLTGPGGKKDKKPVLYFEGKQLGLACNKTNCRTIASLLGTREVEAWAGQAITLYATTCDAGGETKECIRVRNVKPAGKKLPDAAE